MKCKLGNQGYTRMTTPLLIVLFVLILIPFVEPYIRYFGLLTHTNSVIKANEGKPTIIKNEIKSYAEKKKIPLLEENLTVYRGKKTVLKERKTVKVNIYWSDEIDYFGYYQIPVNFVINETY